MRRIFYDSLKRGLIAFLLTVSVTFSVHAACYPYATATGTVTQSGIPTPTNPIEPIFYQQGNMILRKVGNIADSYDATSGKITRRVGVKQLTGTETTWRLRSESTDYKGFGLYSLNSWGFTYNENQSWLSTHYAYKGGLTNGDNAKDPPIGLAVFNGTDKVIYLTTPSSVATTLNAFTSWLATQVTAGKPVTIYYPLATSVTENWTETSYCVTGDGIKIATTKYTEDAFANLVTTLESAINKVTNIVNDTVQQATEIGNLATTKQDRPDTDCPAGRKCLLIMGADNKPHWYLIEE